jgi:hypothetical protein
MSLILTDNYILPLNSAVLAKFQGRDLKKIRRADKVGQPKARLPHQHLDIANSVVFDPILYSVSLIYFMN